MASRRAGAGRRSTGARICLHERDVDNSVPILGANFTDLGDN
jgi:hypothetical protein